MPALSEARSPKVSVCMLAFNHERFIGRAIDSALAQQTTFPFEVVIGEDCSTDGTRQIIQPFIDRHPEQVRVLLRERNLGIRENLRDTLAACRGEYVAMLEGDDYWTDDRKLQRQVDALDAHAEWSICFHRVQVLPANGKPLESEPAEVDFPEVTGLAELLRRNFICTPSVMFRHRLFDEWPPEFSELVQQDWPLHILNAQHGAIGYLPQTMAVYRKHAGGVWSSESMTQRVQWWFDALDAAEDYLGPEYTPDIREARRSLSIQIGEELDTLRTSRDVQWGRAILNPLRSIRQFLRGTPSE